MSRKRRSFRRRESTSVGGDLSTFSRDSCSQIQGPKYVNVGKHVWLPSSVCFSKVHCSENSQSRQASEGASLKEPIKTSSVPYHQFHWLIPPHTSPKSRDRNQRQFLLETFPGTAVQYRYSTHPFCVTSKSRTQIKVRNSTIVKLQKRSYHIFHNEGRMLKRRELIVDVSKSLDPDKDQVVVLLSEEAVVSKLNWSWGFTNLHKSFG